LVRPVRIGTGRAACSRRNPLSREQRTNVTIVAAIAAGVKIDGEIDGGGGDAESADPVGA
jgi:hypothetical protein